jgi:Cu/Ag efflux protein CusF
MKMTLFIAASLVSATLASTAFAQQKMDDMKSLHTAKTPSASAQTVHMAKGIIQKVDLKAGWTLVAHEPISSLGWPAMTMRFKVKDKRLFDKLAVGKTVEFGFVKDGDDYVVTVVR